jgi:GAF domain-containing protein
MRRRSRASSKLATARSRKAKTLKAVRHSSSSASGQETVVARLRRELSEALEQQAAASEVLRVIGGSPGELEPVFNAMLEKAVHVCEAKFGILFRHEGGMVHPAAMLNVPPAYAEFLIRQGAFAPQPGQLFGRICETKKVIHIVDRATERQQHPSVRYGGSRSCIAVPMLKANELIGAFFIYRTEVRPFTDKQIELVQNFAAQAVIAIENARLLNELRQRTTDLGESLEQQTATSEVLKVISSSPGDLQPVFNAILANATRLCEAKFGVLYRSEGDALRAVALHGAPLAYAEERRRNPVVRPHPETTLGRAVATKQTVHMADVLKVPHYFDPPSGYTSPQLPKLAGARTVLAVPMCNDDELVGVIAIYRQEVRPFTDKQIELVTNFAAQAVIAIENARLLNELRQRTDELSQRTTDLAESLEQQTATSEVLGAISSSPAELEPVFQAILANATRLCDAKFAHLRLYDGEAFRWTAGYNMPPEFADMRLREPLWRPHRRSGTAKVVQTKQPVQIDDLRASPAYLEGDANVRTLGDEGGARTILLVPMLKDDSLVGSIDIYRKEVRPFTDKQIELVQNFAAQAVIAIENARLLNELKQRTADLSESLEQQTATSEVLRVISSSPSELGRCSRRCWRTQRASARPSSAPCFCAKAILSGGLQPIMLHQITRHSSRTTRLFIVAERLASIGSLKRNKQSTLPTWRWTSQKHRSPNSGGHGRWSPFRC